MSSKQREHFVRLRQRGRILTPDGLSRLQQAIRAWELEHEIRCTQERIKELTSAVKEGGLDPGTTRKILKAKEGVDPESIRCLFTTFGLQLDETDLAASSRLQVQADPNFVGREGAIADLNALVNRGAKVIVIQARGGVGKTTLARKYLQQEFGSFLEFPIAKETKDIASIESLIEEKLRQLGEEPGREFFVSLDRLKRKLQNERIGILIDNLEPALDSAGKFIEPHRRYVELLRVLTDSTVRSITFVTSRERLREASVTVEHYMLRSLDIEAWEQFFQSRNLATDAPAFAALHNAYGGNAKAMDIIRGAILEDYSGDVAAYWQANQHDLFIERDLEDLVAQQFDRLQQIDPDAYNLLCRMGCYRYQDVPTVPIEGLLCLLWDVPENRQRRVVRALQDRSLVEVAEGEFWLHPVIRSEAIGRLKRREDWETASRKAAEFWTENTQAIDNIADATKALESYYHYLTIQDFENSGLVFLNRRKCKSADYKKLELGRSLERLGLSLQIVNLIKKVLEEIQSKQHKSQLYNVLAVPNRMVGNIHESIRYHQKAMDLSTEYYNSLLCKEESDILNFKSIIIMALEGIILCQIELWELEAALENLKKINAEDVKTLEKSGAIYGESSKHKVECLSAFLFSYLEDRKTFTDFIIEVGKNMEGDEEIGTGRRILLLITAYKNVGLLEKALEMCSKVIDHCKKFNYFGSEIRAINCLAEIYREQENYQLAFDNHMKIIEPAKKRGGLRDLANIYYQFGLTYQAMGEIEKSSENFQEAIRLFTKMEAPKQVERVRRSMEN